MTRSEEVLEGDIAKRLVEGLERGEPLKVIITDLIDIFFKSDTFLEETCDRLRDMGWHEPD